MTTSHDVIKKLIPREARAAQILCIIEGVHAVAWQQCKRSLNDIKQREGC